MSISVDIRKKLGSFSLDVKFEAEDETLAILGASGCGKSMTLKCIAGVETPDEGHIIVDGVTLFDSEKRINLSPQDRHVGLMFQSYALFPNMTVHQNIYAGAKREKDKVKRDLLVSNIMDSFGLSELSDRYPNQLSGGQQQRVALARILVSSPQILLLDEPFSALDSHLRFLLEQEVRHVITNFGKTVLLVSHDRDEVFRMSDKIAVMNEGKIETCGEKSKIFASPETISGALLTGCKNISAIRKINENTVYASDWDMNLTVNGLCEDVGYIGIRMNEISQGDGENSILCKVVDVIENPFSVTVMLKPVTNNSCVPIGWELGKETWKKIDNEEIKICLPEESLLLLRDTSYINDLKG